MARTTPQPDLTHLENGIEKLNKLKWYQRPTGIFLLGVASGVIGSVIFYIITLFLGFNKCN